MKQSSTVVVLFDQISKADFFRRLEWPFLVKAWSKAINWRYISAQKVELELAGLDGLDRVTVSRRTQGNRIFIGARNSKGELVQSGVWQWEEENGLGVCYRRIYKPDLADILCDRLADFCYATFLQTGVCDA